jgi:hypothetical protein
VDGETAGIDKEQASNRTGMRSQILPTPLNDSLILLPPGNSHKRTGIFLIAYVIFLYKIGITTMPL